MSSKIRKICVVVTARPSYSRIKTFLSAVLEEPALELQLVVGASALLDRYGKIENTISSDGFHITAKFHTVLEGESPISMSKTTGLGILELSTIFSNIKPDAVVTIADRYETIATAIAATYMNLPLIHIQGGEVTGSIDERVRHSITKLADFHFPSTELAASRIHRMGEDPRNIFTVGCPSIDLAACFEKVSIEKLNDLIAKNGVGANINIEGPYIVVMQHPVTNESDQSEIQITNLIRAVNKTGVQAVWFWPNVDSGSDGTSRGIRQFREMNQNLNVRFLKNLEPSIFLSLLTNSLGIIGNSSVGIRECSFLGVPCINIGTRQKNRERGPNVIDISYDFEIILASLKKLIKKELKPVPSTLYGEGNAGKLMVKKLVELEFSNEKQFVD